MKNASLYLIKKVNKYCVSERKKRRDLTYNYGTVCVGVEDATQNIRVCSHSFKNPPYYSYQHGLLSNLMRIGVVGKTLSTNGHCVLGYCAEPHAANALLIRLNLNKHKPVVTNTDRFIFTQAIRVRTHQMVKYCEFCKKTFPQL